MPVKKYASGERGEIFVVEKIVRQTLKEYKYERTFYLVKWSGYGPDFNTWEPESNIKGSAVFQQYMFKMKEIKRKRARIAKSKDPTWNKSIRIPL